jgi:hypothetical protein
MMEEDYCIFEPNEWDEMMRDVSVISRVLVFVDEVASSVVQSWVQMCHHFLTSPTKKYYIYVCVSNIE